MAQATTKAYKVLRPLDHNGDRYEPGSTVELPDAAAKKLTALGVVALPAAPEPPAKK
jgi:hypothetical protein